MRLWERFIAWLFSSPKLATHKLQHPDVYPLDVSDIARELALEEEARRLGEAGIPAPEATSLSGPESTVVQRMEKARQDYIDWASQRLSVLNEDLSRGDVTPVVNRALQADKEFERKASALLAQSALLTNDLANAAARRQREFEDFRSYHKLQRDPHYPTVAGTFFHYAILALLIVIEGAANAFFFSQGMTTGLIGGFVAAAIFAGINIIVAFFWGKRAVPYVIHRGATQQIIGFLGVTAALVCMVGISLAIAHFRDALVADAAVPAKAAWEAMNASPLVLNDIVSWALFGVSVVFAVSALFDGFSSDDPYPGYGKIARRAAETRADYLEELDDIRRKLDELKEDELTNLEEGVQRAQSLLSQHAGFIQDKISAELRLQTALRNAENCMDALLRVFRNANELHRNGAPRPSYFDDHPPLQELVPPDFAIQADEAAHGEQQAQVNKLFANADVVRANIQASFNRKYDRLKPLDMQFAGVSEAP